MAKRDDVLGLGWRHHLHRTKETRVLTFEGREGCHGGTGRRVKARNAPSWRGQPPRMAIVCRPVKSSRIEGLTGLRGYAALWVLLLHFTYNWDSGSAVRQVAAHGAYGVIVFFVLSGFILSYVYAGTFAKGVTAGSYRRFLWHRFARVYPPAFRHPDGVGSADHGRHLGRLTE